MVLEQNIVKLPTSAWYTNVDPNQCPSGINWNIGNYYNERKRKEIIVIEEISLSYAGERAVKEIFVFFKGNLAKILRMFFLQIKIQKYFPSFL